MDIYRHLPLSEATYYLLLALDEPLHGYALMQKVESMSGGIVTIGPGTLYGAFNTLEKQGLIVKFKEEERRKYYAITDEGKAILREQLRRLEIMVSNGRAVMGEAK